MLEEMEEKDIIEPSTAAWLSPIVLVKKPDGSQRMCLDYRKVNTHLQVDIHPLPRLEEMVETAAGNKYYATLDMRMPIIRWNSVSRVETSPLLVMESLCIDLRGFRLA